MKRRKKSHINILNDCSSTVGNVYAQIEPGDFVKNIADHPYMVSIIRWKIGFNESETAFDFFLIQVF